MDPAVFHFLNRDRHYTVESFIFVGAIVYGFSKFCWFMGTSFHVTGMLHYNARKFITLLNMLGM